MTRDNVLVLTGHSTRLSPSEDVALLCVRRRRHFRSQENGIHTGQYFQFRHCSRCCCFLGRFGRFGEGKRVLRADTTAWREARQSREHSLLAANTVSSCHLQSGDTSPEPSRGLARQSRGGGTGLPRWPAPEEGPKPPTAPRQPPGAFGRPCANTQVGRKEPAHTGRATWPQGRLEVVVGEGTGWLCALWGLPPPHLQHEHVAPARTF